MMGKRLGALHLGIIMILQNGIIFPSIQNSKVRCTWSLDIVRIMSGASHFSIRVKQSLLP